MHGLTSTMAGATENAMAAYESHKNDFDDGLKFLNSIKSEKIGGLPVGEMLEKIAIRQFEMNYSNRLPDNKKSIAYQNHWNEVKKFYTGDNYNLKDRVFNILVKDAKGKGYRKDLTGKEIVEKIQKHYESWNNKMYKILKGDRLEIEKYRLADDLNNTVDAKFDYN